MGDLIIICPHCGQKNRVPSHRLHEGPRCGRCHRPLPTPEASGGRPIEVSEATFDEEVMQSPVPVVVDLWAPWCGPCRMIAPVLEEIARQYAGRLKVVKVNVDHHPAIAVRYQVQGIPTLLFFHQGVLRDRVVGALPLPLLKSRVEQWLRETEE